MNKIVDGRGERVNGRWGARHAVKPEDDPNRIVDGRFDKDLARLRAMPDKDIDTSDIPVDTDWSGATRGRFAKPPCEHYSIRHKGQIICRDCKAVWNLGLNGPVWVEHDA